MFLLFPFVDKTPADLNDCLSSSTNTGSLCYNCPDFSCFSDVFCLTWAPEVGGTDLAYGTFLQITGACFVNMYFFHPPVTWENSSYKL